MNLDNLLNELAKPEMAALSDAAAAAALAAKTVTRNRDSVATWEIFEAIAPADYTALSAANKSLLGTVLSLGSVSVNGTNTKGVLLGMFAAGTATRTALVALATETVSWLAANGYPVYSASEIAYIRAGGRF